MFDCHFFFRCLPGCAPSAEPFVRCTGADRAAGRVRRHRPLETGLVLALFLFLGTIAPGHAPAAEPAAATTEPVQSLDEQVQAIKSDVLAIAAELGNLEEKLLYPADTQLALFVALEKDDALEVDSARIRIDGQLVAQHVYSWQELQALARGGVQRIHTANLTTGQHELEVTIAGRRGGDAPFEVVERWAFEKAVGPKQVGIRLGKGATGSATVSIESW